MIGRRRTQLERVDWSEAPLAKRYPDWDRFWNEVNKERQAAIAEGREPHPAARVCPPQERRTDINPVGRPKESLLEMEGALTVGEINRQYGSKY